MYKLYTVTKNKTNIKGFWKDDNKKVYIDNIKIKECSNLRQLQLNIKKLIDIGEKAIFYTCKDIATIYNVVDKNESYLVNKIEWQEEKLKASFVKELLRQHNGLTIYRKNGQYLIEIWK